MPETLKIYKGSAANLDAHAVENGALLITTDTGGIYLDTSNIRIPVSAQGDWSQSDETSIDHIKNRTHWKIDGVETYRNEAIVNNSSFQRQGAFPVFTIGTEYDITVNGTTYRCAIKQCENSDYLCLGNDSYWYGTNNTGEPFVILLSQTTYSAIWYSEPRVFNDNTVSSLIISTPSELVQLDDVYIPNSIARISDIPSMDGYATEEYVENLYTTLNSNTVLAFYCIEDVTVTINDIPKVYPANSNVEVRLVEGDSFEIVPTSDNSILSLNAFPGALGTFYPWLEGVSQFSNILFDMNDEAMYTKWSQGNQGVYHVQAAQYTNCIFWSDNGYISDVSKRTNYTLTHSSQLPLCYSTIPDNTFKAFYLAFGVVSDPNWSNPAYKDSFSKATWATQVFSYYGARTIGVVGHDSPDFNIVLPADCRGLMFDAGCVENAGTFDAINCTNLGAKSGSWRDAFGNCFSLRRLYIKNLKVGLNVSWSPIDYNSIAYIISAAANTDSITISVSPYTYNLLSQSDFDLAASKNITIELITTNYVEDRRLSTVDSYKTETWTFTLENGSTVTKSIVVV